MDKKDTTALALFWALVALAGIASLVGFFELMIQFLERGFEMWLISYLWVFGTSYFYLKLRRIF